MSNKTRDDYINKNFALSGDGDVCYIRPQTSFNGKGMLSSIAFNTLEDVWDASAAHSKTELEKAYHLVARAKQLLRNGTAYLHPDYIDDKRELLEDLAEFERENEPKS